VMLARLYQSVGLAFLFIPINTEAFSGIPQQKTNNASALINVARNLGGSIGISIGSTLLTRRSQVHHSVLAANVSAGNPAYRHTLHALTAYFTGRFGPDAPAHALALIGYWVDQQSRLLAYLDTFAVFGGVFLLMLPIVFLMKKRTSARGEAPLVH